MKQPNLTWRRIADDPTIRDALLLRSKVLRSVREWFWDRDFVELDPPTLAPWTGMEPHLSPLGTVVHNGSGDSLQMYHQTSPEYALKKLLAAGMPSCFALGHAFRDGEVTPLHEPEFTLLEWYRIGVDYNAVMADTEQLVAHLAETLLGTQIIERDGHQVNLEPPWERVTVSDAMHRWAGVDIAAHTGDAEAFRAHALECGHDWVTDESWDDLYYKLLISCVEPNLGTERPTILCEYPVRYGALARRKPGDPAVAERFEAYVAGVELCNAFTELTDPIEQRERFESEQTERENLGNDVPVVDTDLLAALSELPECSGNALGIDRLVMLLAGEYDIARVVPFPWREMQRWGHSERGEE
jgi:elongation factor P--(R)-beta-lysine ligase